MSGVKIILITIALSFLTGSPIANQDLEVELPPVRQSGYASYYGDPDKRDTRDGGMYGKITATGEKFDPFAYHCASRTIPLNKIVVIENVENGEVTVCRISDRGPYAADYYDEGWGIQMLTSKGYLIRERKENGEWGPKKYYDRKQGDWRAIMDLTYATAKEIGFSFDSGFTKIRIRYWNNDYKNIAIKERLSNGTEKSRSSYN